jgi:acyl-CoA synthetase (AMP-forming)/AMP-acid ligase II
MLVHHLLDSAANGHPDRVALEASGAAYTYGDLAARSQAMAVLLHDAGLRPGQRVVVLGDGGAAALAAIFAASRIGAIFVVLHPGIRMGQLRHVLEDCSPAVVLAAPSLAGVVAAADSSIRCLPLALPAVCGPRASARHFPQPRPHDPVALIYTSGSTALPKAVVCTHANVCWATQAISQRLEIRGDDVIGSYMPLSFDYGLYQIFLSVSARARLVLRNFTDVGPRLLTQLTRDHVTVLPVVPSMAAVLLSLLKRKPSAAPSLRLITNTGAHFPQAYVDQVRQFLPGTGLALMFGLTECKRISIMLPGELDDHPGSVGRPLDGSQCWIIDEAGSCVPPCVRGELVVSGPHVMAGYWNAPELSASRFRPGPDGSWALFTGDVCSMDASGFLYFHGRGDDIYKWHGFRVSVLEVEVAALAIDGVSAAALVPDTPAGPVLFACSALSPAQILGGLRDQLEDFKLPTQVVTRAELPLTGNGKVDKAALRTVRNPG